MTNILLVNLWECLKDPTLVISPIDSTKFVGGAGIVAAHASGLGAKVDFLSVASKDEFLILQKRN